MPEPLTKDEVDSGTEVASAKQADKDTPIEEQIEDFYKTVDGMKAGLMTTIRKDVGPVARSMAIAKRVGPDFLFLSNHSSNKFSDLAANPTLQLTFQNTSSQDWVSITGTCTTTSNDDPRIKEVYSKMISAWMGDLGDGKHTGGPEDPRMALIELKTEYISWWKSTVGTLGFMKEVGQAVLQGQVAMNGVQREFKGELVEKMREGAE